LVASLCPAFSSPSSEPSGLPCNDEAHFAVVLRSTLKSDSASEEREFSASTVDAITVQSPKGTLKVPAGSVVHGRAVPDGSEDGRLIVAFDSLTTSSGKVRLLNTTFESNDGFVQVQRGKQQIQFRCQVSPGCAPGATICSAIGATAYGKKMQHRLFNSNGVKLDPYRTIATLSSPTAGKVCLRSGDILQLKGSYLYLYKL
jgi:hypothetical protein